MRSRSASYSSLVYSRLLERPAVVAPRIMVSTLAVSSSIVASRSRLMRCTQRVADSNALNCSKRTFIWASCRFSYPLRSVLVAPRNCPKVVVMACDWSSACSTALLSVPVDVPGAPAVSSRRRAGARRQTTWRWFESQCLRGSCLGSVSGRRCPPRHLHGRVGRLPPLQRFNRAVADVHEFRLHPLSPFTDLCGALTLLAPMTLGGQ